MTAVATTVAARTTTRRGFLGGGGPRRTRIAYVYLVPAFLVMGIITLYPLLFQVWMSFTDYGIGNLRATAPPPNYVGVQNYIDILASQLAIPNFHFVRLILYNLFWAFSNVAIHVVLGVAIALLVNTKGLWFKKAYRALFIIPVVIPPLIVATVWKNMYDPTTVRSTSSPVSQVPRWHLTRSDRLAPPGRRPDPFIRCRCVLRNARDQHLARLAAQRRRL